jgi:CSLREA domain-containing protein
LHRQRIPEGEEIMSQSIKGRASRTLHRHNTSSHTLEPLDPRLLLSTTYVVNTLDDESTPDDNLLSLREAITQANTNAGADAVTFAPDLTGTIKLLDGQLDITDDLTITGPGVKRLAVSGNGNSRVFNIADFKVSISNLAISGGVAPLREDGGGIQNVGTLTLNRVLFQDNQAGYGGDTFDNPAPSGGLGGAIFNGGALTISNAAFVDNVAGSGGNGYDDFAIGGSGGDGGDGGAIYNNAMLLCTNTTFNGNQAGFGGFGGDSSFGTGGDGGSGGSGGAIANNGDATLVNVTVSENYAGFGGLSGVPNGRSGLDGIGGGLYNRNGNLTLANSIVADNDIGAPVPDAAGDYISLGHNIVSVTDGSSGWIASDITGTNNAPVDAKLDSLKDNGGPTRTVALLAGSPAINAADKSLISTYNLSTDQRGYARVYNRLPDIGAFEAGSAYPADANHDGSVDFNDLVKLAQNYNNVDGQRTWEQGDFNGDGNVDFNDLVILAQNYNTTPAANDAAPPAMTTTVAAAPLLASANPAPSVTAESLLASFQPTIKKKPAPKAIFNVIKPIKPIKPSKPIKH